MIAARSDDICDTGRGRSTDCPLPTGRIVPSALLVATGTVADMQERDKEEKPAGEKSKRGRPAGSKNTNKTLRTGGCTCMQQVQKNSHTHTHTHTSYSPAIMHVNADLSKFSSNASSWQTKVVFSWCWCLVGV